MTDHTDHSDAEPTGEEYEPPRAVYLSAVSQGLGDNCRNHGVSATDDCDPAGSTAGHYCDTGGTPVCPSLLRHRRDDPGSS